MIEEYPNQPDSARKSGCASRGMIVTGALVLVVGVAGYGAWQSGWIEERMAAGLVPSTAHLATTPSAAPSAAPVDPAALASQIGALEQRLARLDAASAALAARTDNAAAQAGRAEALLAAFATRRAIESGKPLGYLEGQLRLRFGTALPNVVNALVGFARQPVTQDRLVTQFEVLAPQLVGPDEQSNWSKIKRDLSGLFVLHSSSGANTASPKMRLDHARLCLREGKIDAAIADVRLLPGAKAATQWIADATRYAEAMRGLDALDTAALLEPKLLKDGAGRPIEQASPIAQSPAAASSAP